MKSNHVLFILFTIGIISCKQHHENNGIAENSEPQIVNFDDKVAFNSFSELNLDDTCVNLLDPRNTSESERTSVVNSWSNFHKKVTTFLKEENFEWEVPDSTITIYNRIYFHKNGTINYYVFNINNPSISEEKKAEFEKVLLKFSEEIRLDLQKDEPFSQCGKTKYINY